MSEIQKYEIEFVERTKEILETSYQYFKEKDREVTFLLNCLLGLIVNVSENEKRSNQKIKGVIDNNFLLAIPDKIGFLERGHPNGDLTDNNRKEFYTVIGHKKDLSSKQKTWFLNKVRNGIAHQNIKGLNERGLCVGIILWNTNNFGEKDFEVIFTIDELRNFAIKVATEYLEPPPKKLSKPVNKEKR